MISRIKRLPAARTETIVFMIGLGYIDPETHKWVSKEFTTNRLTFEEEGRICQEFSTFILEKAAQYGVDQPRCYHWSPAEDNMWNDAVDRHDPISDQWNSLRWDWVDLLEIFKEEPIVINGCMSFGLKDVAAAMKAHGFIQTAWDKTSACIDGQSAMIAAHEAHRIAHKANGSMRSVPVINEIIRYNKVDVRVMYEIMIYLRNNHTGTVSPVVEKNPRGRKRPREDSSTSERSPKRSRVTSDQQRSSSQETSSVSNYEMELPLHPQQTSSASSTDLVSLSESYNPKESKRGIKRRREDTSESQSSERLSASDQSDSMLGAMNDAEHSIQPVADGARRSERLRRNK